jgi:hypothetical protein
VGRCRVLAETRQGLAVGSWSDNVSTFHGRWVAGRTETPAKRVLEEGRAARWRVGPLRRERTAAWRAFPVEAATPSRRNPLTVASTQSYARGREVGRATPPESAKASLPSHLSRIAPGVLPLASHVRIGSWSTKQGLPRSISERAAAASYGRMLRTTDAKHLAPYGNGAGNECGVQGI